jgi:WD40 repeat protein
LAVDFSIILPLNNFAHRQKAKPMNEPTSKPVIFLAFANDKVDTGAYLRNLTQERNGIRDALMPAQEQGLCEVLVEPDANIDRIIGVFQSKNYRDRIAIFHYGGHADSYQLLLETYKGERAIAHSEGLVSFLAEQKGLQLVFLNGCSTQQQADELIEAGIPAVVGTSQKINDEVATSLSVRFYKGLGEGITIQRAWKEAEDQVKLEKGATNFRALYWAGKAEKAEHLDRFPWSMLRREGAEDVMGWNLPDAAENPLFGLPPLPENITPPEESPFLFLKRYERQHAAIFFGRSYYVRDLYNRVSDPKSPPVILFYGQSGVGKSSLLDAGLNPRLEETNSVTYIRRIQQRGLAGTLEFAIDQFQKNEQVKSGLGQRDLPSIEEPGHPSPTSHLRQRKTLRQLEAAAKDAEGELKQEIESLIQKLQSIQPETSDEQPASSDQQPVSSDQYSVISVGEVPDILRKWRQIEAQTGKPLIVILDQVEEIFTRPNLDLPEELDDFLMALRFIFSSPTLHPRGKLILGYRKEYHPEIEERFKIFRLPRTRVFVEALRRKDLLEIFRGLTNTPALKDCYRLAVEDDLPVIIADDLLEDKDSPVAPVLQIVLTKLWGLAVKENPEAPCFTVAQYQKLRKEGIAMGEFFAQQMQQLRRWRPDAVDSGLALDVLQFHTTALATAGSRSLEELRQAYQHRQDIIDELIAKCKELYLLAEAPQTHEQTSLAHDTLAPVVSSEYNYSDKPSQRAVRILSHKVTDFRENEKEVWLDEADLAVVEEGIRGMRRLSEDEQKLLEISRQRKKQLERERKRNWILRRVAVAVIAVFAGIAVWKWLEAHEKALLANYFIAKDYEAKAAKAFNDALTYHRTEDYQKAWLYTLEALEKPIPANRRLPISESRFLDPELRMKAFVEKWRSPLPESGPVYGVAISPDGQTLASASSDSVIRLRNTLTGEERRKLAGHTGIVYGIAFSPDGRTLASASTDSTIGLWNLSAGAAPRMLTGHAGIVYSVVFSPDGKTVASASFDNTVRLWNVEGGTESRSTFLFPANVNSVAFSPDGKTVACGLGDGTIRLANAETGIERQQLQKQNKAVKCVAFSPDGRTLAFALADGTIRMWDYLIAGAKPRQLDGHTDIVNSIAFSPDGKILASGSDDETIRLWEVKAGTSRLIITGHAGVVKSVAFSSDGKTLVSGSDDRSVRLWEVEMKTERRLLAGHTDLVNSFAFSADGKTVASGSPDGTVRLWDVETGAQRDSLTGHSAEVNGLAFTRDGKTLASASADGTIRLWDVQTGREYPGHRDNVNGVAFSPDGKALASASSDSTIHLWDRVSGAEHKLGGHSDVVLSVAFSPDGKTLVSASVDKTIRLWDMATGVERFLLTGSKGIVYSVAFSPDGKTVASASADSTIRLWDTETGNQRRALFIPAGAVYGIAFNPEGMLMASWSDNETIQLWPIWHLEIDSEVEAGTAAFDSVLQASLSLFPVALELEGEKRKARLMASNLKPRPFGKDPVRWLRGDVRFAEVATPETKAPADIPGRKVEPEKPSRPTAPPPGAGTDAPIPPPSAPPSRGVAGNENSYTMVCAGLRIDLAEPVLEIAAAMEAEAILFDSEPLSDNSGIFHRFLQALKQRCPNIEIPEVSLFRSSRDLARWYDQRGELVIIQDALQMAEVIKPGAVMFYGASDKLYNDFTLDKLFSPDGISHIGVVVEVEKNEAGQVVNYKLFHGRSPGKIAGTTNYHRRQPSRPNLPPLGNWNQQWVAFARMVKSE